MNTLNVGGSAADILKFREWLNGEPLTLNKILPMPKELEETTSPTPDSEAEKAKELAAKYGASNWYDWHINNWGTKWDCDIEEADYDTTPESIVFNFDSAWSPPTKAIVALSKLFPTLSLTLTYREDGCAFAGILKVGNDEFEDIYHDSSQDEAAYRQFVIDEFGDDPMAPFDDEEDEAEDLSTKIEVKVASTNTDLKLGGGAKKKVKKVKKATKKPTKKVKKTKTKTKVKKKKK